MSNSTAQALSANQKNVRLDIQGLRALAVILVILFHLGLPVPGGFIGVDVFFVISGYVITAMLEREWLTHGRINIPGFFRRRFWRLTPALATVVAVTLIVGSGVVSAIAPKNSPQQIMVATGLGAVLLSANLVIAKLTGTYFDNSAETNVLLNTWSLSVEEQFYIGFLLILVLGWTIGKIVKREKLVVRLTVCMVFACSLFIALLAQPGGPLDTSNWLFHFYSPLNRAWEFAAGALVALLAKNLEGIPNRFRELSAVLGCLIIIYSALFITAEVAWPGIRTLAPVIGAVLLIAAPVNMNSKIYPLLSNKAAVFIGDRSYSLYLWHWPVIVIVGYLNFDFSVRLAFDIAAIIALTLITYRFIENKFRYRKPVTRSTSIVTALLIFTFPIAVAFAVNFSLKHNYWNSNLAKQHFALTTNRIGQTNACNLAVSYLHRSAKKCTWNSSSAETPIYLVGDSNAEQFSDAVVEAANKTNHPLVIANRYGCPFLTSKYVQPDRSALMSKRDLNCWHYYSQTREWLKGQRPGLIIISNTESYVTVPRLRTVAFNDVDSPGANQYYQLLAQTIKDLQGDGFSVAMILGPPHFDSENPDFPSQFDWNPTKCNLKSILDNGCKSVAPLSVVDAYQTSYLKNMKNVAAKTNAQIIDVSRFFCTSDSCSTQLNGLQIYRDGSHITVGADLKLVPIFVREIKRLTNSAR